MNTAALKAGDRVECCVRGVPFTATLGHKDVVTNKYAVTPTDPRRITHRFVTPRQIVKKLASGVGA